VPTEVPAEVIPTEVPVDAAPTSVPAEVIVTEVPIEPTLAEVVPTEVIVDATPTIGVVLPVPVQPTAEMPTVVDPSIVTINRCCRSNQSDGDDYRKRGFSTRSVSH
jgi:hypothetical protein